MSIIIDDYRDRDMIDQIDNMVTTVNTDPTLGALPEITYQNTVSTHLPVDIAPRNYPKMIKYMGSKASLLPFIATGIESLGDTHDRPLVDLFAGAGALAGGFGHRFDMVVNDIQVYSEVLCSSYLNKATHMGRFDIVDMARAQVSRMRKWLPEGLAYPKSPTLDQFNAIEALNQSLIERESPESHHLFTRYYSGTWWSADQCIWIDSIRAVLQALFDQRKITQNDYYLGLGALMHAVAYASQGTGHFAQYRDAKTDSSMNDINKYRQAHIPTLFDRKMQALWSWNQTEVPARKHELLSVDYADCLASLKPSIIYADPPYAMVHYSRFYHALETLVLYDYPTLQVKGGKLVKGRYREDRHQSPFCHKTGVKASFKTLFDGVRDSTSHLLMSYSNTAVMNMDDMLHLAMDTLGEQYALHCLVAQHDHMTMGRQEDRSREVREWLIVCRYTGK